MIWVLVSPRKDSDFGDLGISVWNLRRDRARVLGMGFRVSKNSVFLDGRVWLGLDLDL